MMTSMFPFSAAHAQNLLWAKRAGGTALDLGQAIAVDALGNSYVTGRFGLTATFGPGDFNQTALTTTGQDAFVAKYHITGLLIWAKRIAGTTAIGTGIAVDGAGNVYVTGTFSNTVTFAPTLKNEITLTSSGGVDFFVAKYDVNGDFLWAKSAGGTVSVDVSNGIAVDGAGNSYVAGSFSGVATFGLGELNEVTLAAPASADVLVAKFNTDGLFQWVQRGGGANSDQGWAIAADSAGNSYVTGSFSGTATFSPGAGQVILTTAAGSTDIFVAKYNSSGALQWAKAAAGTSGGTTIDAGYGIAADIFGNSYVTGSFQQTVTFALGVMLTADGDSDIFTAKYDLNGNLLWAKRAGGTGIDFGQGIAADAFGNSYVTGYFRDAPATLGLGELNETVLTSAGNEDVFIAKYDKNGLLKWAKRAGGLSDDRGLGIGIDAVGNSFVTGRFAGTARFGPGEPNQIDLTSANNADIFVAKFAAGTIDVSCPTDSLQAAINLAAAGSTILVTGTCNENLLVRNEKQRITIDGAGAGAGTRATVNGSGGSPTFNIRGKGILLQNFTIAGGSVGVYVNRGANAVLNNNIVQASASDGVVVDELAFAVLTNNTIQNHPGAGVLVGESSTARIGFNADSETAASLNTIRANAVGIVVSNRASARIVGNDIVSNTGDGVRVVRDSLAEISNNLIDLNSGTGIVVLENSGVTMGEDSGGTIFELPNSTVANNGGFGYRCNDGSLVDGRLGTLSGNTGNTNSGCVDSLLP